MRAAIAVVLAIALAVPAARAESPDAGTADAGSVSAPDGGGKSVELEAGQLAPFRGNLCDVECAAEVWRARRAAEELAKLRGIRLQDAEAARAAAEGRPTWGLVLGVGGGALAAGLVVGLVLGLRAK